MNRNPTPSLGEFAGLYNVNVNDYHRILSLPTEHYLISSISNCPALKSRENLQVKKEVKSILTSYGIRQINKELDAGFFWPEQVFFIDENIVDRTVHAFLSSCNAIATELLLELQRLLTLNYPLWRIILRFSFGDEADIAIYPSIVRIGDSDTDLLRGLDAYKHGWLEAETMDGTRRNSQLSWWLHRRVTDFHKISDTLYILAVFRAPFISAVERPNDCTLWLGTEVKSRKKIPMLGEVSINGKFCTFAGIFRAVNVRGELYICPESRANFIVSAQQCDSFRKIEQFSCNIYGVDKTRHVQVDEGLSESVMQDVDPYFSSLTKRTIGIINE